MNRSVVFSIILIMSSYALAEQRVDIVPKPQIVEYLDNPFDPCIDDVSVNILADDTLNLNIPVRELGELSLQHYNPK